LDGKNDGVQDEQYHGKTDADIIWRLDMMKELNVFPHLLAASSPLVAGDLVYVVTGNGIDGAGAVPSPQAPSFVAVNKLTGKVVWSDASPGKDIMDGQWGSPAYAVVNGTEQVIFPGGDGWLRGFEAKTGKPLWKFDCNPKSAVFKPGGRGNKSYLVATPVVYDNKVYIGLGRQPDDCSGVGHFWCIDITKTGDLSPVNDNFDAKAAVNKNSGLVWHRGGAVTPRPKIGRDVHFGCTMSTAAICEGLLYIAEKDGYLSCFDAATGKEYWQHDLKSDTWCSPYYADSKIYMCTNDGDVHIFAPGKELKPLGKMELETALHCTPVAVGRVLYIQTDSRLFALAKP
jgi:outer membrane protein assembly factor BamB